MGIEPTQPAWKAGILPLNYTRISWLLSSAAATGARPVSHSVLKHSIIPNALCQQFSGVFSAEFIIFSDNLFYGFITCIAHLQI